MADQNKTHADTHRFNEVLSPSDLFAARSRSHKIPVRGQKEFYKDGTDRQTERTTHTLTQHFELIAEERVEKLGNLVKGTWMPEEQIVELQSPAGKFWQTMGFSSAGKQCLLPEEALYLMECGNVQVFYKDLPLSIQDGYERFLSTDTVSLLQYQVFGHLKRLGYVVHRFTARQMNVAVDRSDRQKKRKRSPSPTPTPPSQTPTPTPTATASCSATLEDCTSDRMEVDGRHSEASAGTSSGTSGTSSSSKIQDGVRDSDSADRNHGNRWWASKIVPEEMEKKKKNNNHSEVKSHSFQWDFSAIHFPDVGCVDRRQHAPFSPMDGSLLPASIGVCVGVCDVAPWRRKINLRQIKMSAREREREERKRRRRWDINKDREVRRCRNWSEYRALMERRQTGRPDHLWKREVRPLHDPTLPIHSGELLEKISVIPSTNLREGASRLAAAEACDWSISFSVFQPDSVSDFKKSNPGKPYARMCVCSFSGPVPDLRSVKRLSSQCEGVQLVFAAVDQGDISFYTFKDFTLPTDVFS